MRLPPEIVDKYQQRYLADDGDTSFVVSKFDEPLGKIGEFGAHDEPMCAMLVESGHDVYGFDLRPPDKSLPPCNYTHIQGDFCKPNAAFAGEHFGTFDTFVCISVIEHVGLGTYKERSNIHHHYDTVGMHMMYLYLKPGGVVYLTTPMGGRHINYAPHWRIYNVKTLNYCLVGDFIVEEQSVFFTNNVVINNVLYHRNSPITRELVESHVSNPPHISVFLKLRKPK